MGEAAAIVLSAAGVGMNVFGQAKAGATNRAIAFENAAAIERTSELNAQLIEEGIDVNSEVFDFNARIAEAQARDSIRRGREAEEQLRTDVRQTIGAQRASYGAQGIEIGTGSPLDVQTDTAYQGELDAIQLRTNAALEAWGYGVEADDIRRQKTAMIKTGRLQARNVRDVGRANAQSARRGGTYAAQSGTLGAIGSAISGSGDILYRTLGRKRAT